MIWARSAIGVGLLCGVAQAQEAAAIGRVRVGDAQIAGTLEVSGDEALLRGSATVTARERTAELRLQRGGEVQVCQTSVVHVAMGPQQGDAPAPLLLALDRGAMQVHTAVTMKDALLTPDLRFAVTRAGLLNLGIRVVRNGDTCVENSGAGAPVLEVEEQLSGAGYELRPEQHVLFERGSVREVVDHETSPCGCPPVTTPQQLAGTGGGGTVVGGASPQKATAAEHPFPAAESEGLAPGGEVPQAPAGQVHAQVGATLAYGDAGTDSGGGMTPAPAASSPAGTAAATPAAAPGLAANAPSATPDRAAVAPSAPPPPVTATGASAVAPAPKAADRGGVFQRIGHFFKRLLG